MRLEPLICANCAEPNERNADSCVNCSLSLGFTNVNIYTDSYFKDGLDNRYKDAKKEAGVRGFEDLVVTFEEMINKHGKAVINMDVPLLEAIVLKRQPYLSYRLAVEKGLRLKASFLNDKDRNTVESSFYGIDGGKIVYAALALDDVGLRSYGSITVTLKTDSIQSRTTVFERNTYFLFDDFLKMGWKVRGPIPTGYAGIWKDCDKIAVCKHIKMLETCNPSTDWSTIVLHAGTTRDEDEFIELHIYNSLNWRALEKITVHVPPKSKKEQLDLEYIKEEALKQGILFEEK